MRLLQKLRLVVAASRQSAANFHKFNSAAFCRKPLRRFFRDFVMAIKSDFRVNLQIVTSSAFLSAMRLKRFGLFAAGLAVAAIFVAGCSPNPSNVFQGYIEGEYVYVAAPLGGSLTNLAVARGDSVKAGQLLLNWSAVPRPTPSRRRKKISRRPKPSWTI